MKNAKSLYHAHRFPAAPTAAPCAGTFAFGSAFVTSKSYSSSRVIVSYETIRRWCEWNEQPPANRRGDVAAHCQAEGIEVPKLEDRKDLPEQTGVTIMKQTIVGVDIAKNAMQVHWGVIRTAPRSWTNPFKSCLLGAATSKSTGPLQNPIPPKHLAVDDCTKRKLVGDILQPFVACPDGHLRHQLGRCE